MTNTMQERIDTLTQVQEYIIWSMEDLGQCEKQAELLILLQDLKEQMRVGDIVEKNQLNKLP